MKQKILQWLNKTGYPLELFTYRSLRKNGYSCEKSVLYQDLETNSTRELDINAYQYGDDYEQHSYGINLLIECKKSEKPLLILTDSEKKEARYSQLLATEACKHADTFAKSLGYAYLSQLEENELTNKIGLFSEKTFVGYSIIQAFNTTDREWFKVLYGLAKAEYYYGTSYAKFFREMRTNKKSHPVDRNPFQLRVPILVVDAPLHYVYLDKDSEVYIQETQIASVTLRLPWNLGDDEEIPTNIQIIHKDALNDFLENIWKLFSFISKPSVVDLAISK